MIGTILGTIAMLLLAPPAPPATTGRATNAAVLYRQSIAALPPARDRTPAQSHALIFPEAAPLDAEVQELIDQSAAAFELFEEASSVAACDWGFRDAMPQDASNIVSRASDLVEFITLRIRRRAAAGEFEEALADCRRLALLGRRIGQPPTSMARLLQSTVYFNRAIICAAIVARDAPLDRVAAFERSLRDLPSRVPPAEVVAAEKRAYLGHVRAVFEHPEALEMARNFSRVFEMDEDKNKPDALSPLEDLLKNPAKRAPALADVGQVFDEAAEIYRLDEPRRPAAWKALEQRVDAMHPLARNALRLGRAAELYEQMERDMLEMFGRGVRILAQRDAEPATLMRIAEPFVYVRRTTGFELRERADDPKQRQVLTFGPHDPAPPPLEPE